MSKHDSVRRIVGGQGAQTQYAPRSYEAAMADLSRPEPSPQAETAPTLTMSDMTDDQRAEVNAIQANLDTPLVELLSAALDAVSKHSGGWPMWLRIDQFGSAKLVNDNGGTSQTKETLRLSDALQHHLGELRRKAFHRETTGSSGSSG